MQKNNEQIIKNIDTFLTSLAAISEFPYHDIELKKILRKNYIGSGNSLKEMLEDVDKANSILYSNIFRLNSLIGSVTVIPNNMNYVFNVSVIPSYTVSYPDKTSEWFEKIVKGDGKEVIFGIHKDFLQREGGLNVISVCRSIVEPFTGEVLGVIVLNVRADKFPILWEDVSITPESKFAVIDEADNVVYGSNIETIGINLSEIYEFSENEIQDGKNLILINGEYYCVNAAKSDYCRWRVISLTPKNELLKEITNIRNLTIYLCLILILFSIGLSALISSGVTKPIFKLKNTMKAVENGNLNVTSDIYGGEIGELSISFNKMVNKMRKLIEEIYKQETEKRNAEIMALQSQVNPHFMYNTLNTIKWMAHIQGSKGIVTALDSLIQLLVFTSKINSRFITIEEELELLSHYLNIMNLRFFNKFTVEYDIDKNVYKYKTLKFILQPIVENAIIHGFGDSQIQGKIKVKVALKNNTIDYIIEDNGKGMSEETIKRALMVEDDGSEKKFNKIGLYNVNKRIKLEFGEQYGLNIISQVGKYTKVIMKTPIIE